MLRREVLRPRSWLLELAAIAAALGALAFTSACTDSEPTTLYTCKRPGDVYSYVETCAASREEAEANVRGADPALTCESTGYDCDPEDYLVP